MMRQVLFSPESRRDDVIIDLNEFDRFKNAGTPPEIRLKRYRPERSIRQIQTSDWEIKALNVLIPDTPDS